MILTLKSPGTSVRACQSHQTVTDLWCGQIPRRGSDVVLTLILTNSPEKSWVTFAEQWHYCFKKKKRYGLLLHEDAQCKRAFQKWTYICPYKPQSQWDTQVFKCDTQCSNVCIENQKENRHVPEWDIFIFEIDSAYYVQATLHFYS